MEQKTGPYYCHSYQVEKHQEKLLFLARNFVLGWGSIICLIIHICTAFPYRHPSVDPEPGEQPERLQHQGGRRRLLRVQRARQPQALQGHLEVQREYSE